MSPRPKAATDAAILNAASRVLTRMGPAHMRLEDVAKEVGLAPATLLLRFKSKRGLLLAVADNGLACMTAEFARQRALARSPLDAIGTVSDCVKRMADSPQALANSLAFLQLNAEDPEFMQRSQQLEALLLREMEGLLTEARTTGELVDCSIAALARAIIAITRGSLLTWSTSATSTPPETWVKADLDTLLRHYRRPSTAVVARPRSAGRVAPLRARSA